MANFIRAWRKHRGLTQERLAERIDMSNASLSRIERGEQPYSQPVLEAIAYALNTTPAALLERDPAAPEAEVIDLLRHLPLERQRQAVRLLRALAAEDAA